MAKPDKKAAKLEAKAAKLEAKAAKKAGKSEAEAIFTQKGALESKRQESSKDEKPVYIQCPRCELNYILKKDKLCTVCKAEVGLIDASILIPEEEETERLCPVCNTNYLGEDESVCFLCQKEREKKPVEDEEEWEDFEPEPEEEELVPEEGLGIRPEDMGFDEEEGAEEEEEEEDYSAQYAEPDDFEYEVNEDDFLDRPEDEDDDDDDDDFGE